LQQLVAQAEANHLDLVSLMVQLRCQSFWERLLIPAFVFFFQMLYPFPWVNQFGKKTAAAAGGCALIRFGALKRIDGLRAIKDALIDDCALGAAVKQGGPIWLGLSTTTRSLRPYPDLSSIWNMVTRSAYTQLNYSPWLLIGTVLGMGLVYLVSPLGIALGVLWGQPLLVLFGLVGWLLMALAYWPTVNLYSGNPFWALTLPLIAVLYTLMTVDSARRHWQGQGGAWKGRVYSDMG
jgi:hopene-associated glycosyltransferase HpnB